VETAGLLVLGALKDCGVQTIDLEGLADHKGSLLGASAAPQPSQKMFESRLAAALARMDPARPVVLEAESSKVGARLIPAAVWKSMMAAPRIDVSVPLPARAAFLARDYADILALPGVMAARLDSLRPFCGHDQVGLWQQMLRSGAHQSLAASLMEKHYDPCYVRSRKARAHTVLGTVRAEQLDAAGIAQLADQVRGLLG